MLFKDRFTLTNGCGCACLRSRRLMKHTASVPSFAILTTLAFSPHRTPLSVHSITYKRNEVFLDVIEKLNVLVSQCVARLCVGVGVSGRGPFCLLVAVL